MLRASSNLLKVTSVAAFLHVSYSASRYNSANNVALCESEKPRTSNTQVHAKNYKKRYVYVPTTVEEVQSEQDPHIAIISGSSNPQLSQKICRYLDRGLSTVEIRKFSDGEIFINIKESLRGKDVYIIQTCSPPVNDSVMELFLAIAAAKRAGATRVTAVIPYLGYRLNRRGLPISTTHNTRFLWNAAIDLAKMLHVAGADKVISMDLQRPGQGHEACFFPTYLPAETITSNDSFVRYFTEILNPETPVVVVSPNVEFTKKAKKFESKLKQISDLDVSQGLFLRTDADTPNQKGAALDFKGDVKGADVILIEDYVGK